MEAAVPAILLATGKSMESAKPPPVAVALPMVTLTMTNDAVAIARYFTSSDTDTNGLVDWQDEYWFGVLGHNLDSDPDGDGFTMREELTRGYSFAVRDEIADGGIMVRLSDNAIFRDASQKKTLRYSI